MASSTTVPVESRSPNHKHNLSLSKWNSSRPRNFRSPTNINTTTAATNESVAFDDNLVTESSRSRSRSRGPVVRQSSIFSDCCCEGYLSPPPPPPSSPLLLPTRPDVDDNEVAPAKCHSPGRGCFGNQKNPIECRGKLRIQPVLKIKERSVPSINRGGVVIPEDEEEKQEELEDQSNKTKSSAILIKLASKEGKEIGQEDGKRNNASDLDEKKPKPEQRTWNLRPRKTKPLMDYNGREFTSSVVVVKDKGIQSTEMNVNPNPIISETGKKKGLKISLSKKEIEEDFLAFTGSKPRRNPKKRSKTAQYLINYQLPCSRRMKPCIIADD